MSEQADYAIQPLPTPNEHPPIIDTVITEFESRRAFGIRKYGTTLQPFNGRDPLQDAIDEACDLVVYLVQVREERDATRGGSGSGQDDGSGVLDARSLLSGLTSGERHGALPEEPFRVVVLSRDGSESDHLGGALLPQPNESQEDPAV